MIDNNNNFKLTSSWKYFSRIILILIFADINLFTTSEYNLFIQSISIVYRKNIFIIKSSI